MKLYKRQPQGVVRIEIRGENSKVFTVQETSIEEAKQWVYEILNNKLILINPTVEPTKVRVLIYEAWGNYKGKSTSIVVFGMSIQEIYDILMKNIEK